jgi:hypothetical protein
MIHPFYETHRGAMEAAMDEFEIVLTQMPYVGGAAE